MNYNSYIWWSLFLFLSSIISFIISIEMLLKQNSILLEWEILKLNSTEMMFIMFMDWMASMFMATVLMISSMILLYSNNYMMNNKMESKRFIMLINLFILSMMLMIISPNMISIMLGWDGLGLISYCLVIFYTSKKSYNSGMITCLTNRLGDIGLLVSISWMMSYGSWHFMFYKEMYTEMILYLVLISCFTKSAQMPFYSWLPEAMSAPTPISALVHSSTLVTAGVYLSIRFMNSIKMETLMMMSILTTMMASICANYEFDLKKIIALSTLSQLGLMMMTNLMGMKEISFMHLLTHAMFKSLLFMSAGIMIFYSSNNQDIRNLSMTHKTLPMTSTCFLISTMALCGIPFLTGFYSKDNIMENTSMNMNNITSYIAMYMSLGLTVSYSLRVTWFLTMKKIKNNMSLKIKFMNKMKLGMILLSILSITHGASLMWMLNLNLNLSILTEKLKMTPVLMIILGNWIGQETLNFKKSNNLTLKMWNILSMMSITQKNTFLVSQEFKMKLNMSWGEFYGAMGLSKLLLKISLKSIISKNNMFFMSISAWMACMI
uniref:NADH:ubiquinone reductase (H(+)-translocating) n=1 Tax=Dusuna sp. TaxID=3133678 RepID=A0AAU6PBY2_9HEMI